MDDSKVKAIASIRSFNRFYTNTLGLLDRNLLQSSYSLAEVRVLYEIGHIEMCTAKFLMEELSMDGGYLSRIIKRFEKDGLVVRKQSDHDRRLFFLTLTPKGLDNLVMLEAISNAHIGEMIQGISNPELVAVLEGMETIESHLSRFKQSKTTHIKIRTELKPGDVGYLIHLHGWIYARECGYNHRFEGYVCKTFYDFYENYHPEKDRIWLAEDCGEIIGAIAIVGHSQSLAQLRWFIIHPDYRGIGLGRKLMDNAMAYSREKGYQKLFLSTSDEQKTAIGIYLKAGFKKVSENEIDIWGKRLFEETYELDLET